MCSFAKQLSGMFHHISMLSLCLPWLPQIWKWAVAKKNPPMVLNGLGLLARTSLLMKSMEKLIKKETVRQVEKLLDPFLIWTSRGVEDAVILLLNFLYAHLEGQKTRTRLHFC